MTVTTLRPLWFVSPSGIRMYAGAERDADGWVVRLYDHNGKQISQVVYRIAVETSGDDIPPPLPVELVNELMSEMRRQVMTNESVFVSRPGK